MKREEFLSKLGIGALAVCMGCSMVACCKSGYVNTGPGYYVISGNTLTVTV